MFAQVVCRTWCGNLATLVQSQVIFSILFLARLHDVQVANNQSKVIASSMTKPCKMWFKVSRFSVIRKIKVVFGRGLYENIKFVWTLSKTNGIIVKSYLIFRYTQNLVSLFRWIVQMDVEFNSKNASWTNIKMKIVRNGWSFVNFVSFIQYLIKMKIMFHLYDREF